MEDGELLTVTKMDTDEALTTTESIETDQSVIKMETNSELVKVESVDGPSWACDTCNQGFPSYVMLQTHISSNSCMFPGYISQGSNSFQPSKGPLSHQIGLSHSVVLSEVPLSFKCSHCPQSFHNAEFQQKHEATIHKNPEILQEIISKRRRAWCKFCNRTFANEWNLNKHNSVFHGAGAAQSTQPVPAPESVKPQKRLKCSQCPQLFQTEDYRRKHEDSIHKNPESLEEINSKRKRVWCQVCNRIFANEWNLKKHNSAWHGISLAQAASTQTVQATHPVHTHPGRTQPVHTQPVHTQPVHTQPVHNQPTINPVHTQPPINSLHTQPATNLVQTQPRNSANTPANAPTFKCTICSATFRSRFRLTAHRKVHGPSPDTSRLFKCSICSVLFVHWNTFEDHVWEHSKSRGHTYKCKTCPQQFPVLGELKAHYEKEHPGREPELGVAGMMLQCAECGIRYVKEAHLAKHMAEVHLRPVPPPPPAKAQSSGPSSGPKARTKKAVSTTCGICCVEFPSRKVRMAHRLSHAVDGVFKCHLCPDTFAKGWNLEAHLRVHRAKEVKLKELRLKVCEEDEPLGGRAGQIELNLSDLPKYSEDIQAGAYTVVGSEAVWTASTRPEASGSLIDSVPAGWVKCGLCPALFPTRNELYTHSLLHSSGGGEYTGGYRFKCHLCPEAFEYGGNLDLHLKMHSVQHQGQNGAGGEEPSLSGRPLFQCPDCSATFSLRQSLELHALSHGIHRCVECSARFANLTDLRDHVTVLHTNPSDIVETETSSIELEGSSEAQEEQSLLDAQEVLPGSPKVEQVEDGQTYELVPITYVVYEQDAFLRNNGYTVRENTVMKDGQLFQIDCSELPAGQYYISESDIVAEQAQEEVLEASSEEQKLFTNGSEGNC